MGMFNLGVRNYQVKEAVKTGEVKLSRWQRFIGFFNENSIRQVKDLQQNLPACKTYQERANLCAESVRNPEIRNSLSLHLAGTTQSAINLHLDFNGQSHLIHEDFITPTNDDNQGFTFDKKKHQILSTGQNGGIKYADSMPKLSNNEMNDIKFKLETGENVTLNNLVAGQSQKLILEDGKLLTIKNQAGISDIQIYNSINENENNLSEQITLIKHAENGCMIQSQSKVGELIPDYSTFESLTYSYQDVQQFLESNNHEIRAFANNKELNQLEFTHKFNNATHKIIVTQSVQDGKVKITILPPKYLTKETVIYPAHKETKIYDDNNYFYKLMKQIDPKYSKTQIHDVPERQEIKKDRVYHLPQGKNRVYKYGGVELHYDYSNIRLSNINEVARKKSKRPEGSDSDENANDEKLRPLQHNNKTYYIGNHYRGMTFKNFLENNLMTDQIKTKITSLAKSALDDGKLFWDLSFDNIIIDKNLNLKICDGTMDMAKAEYYDVNMFISRLNSAIGSQIANIEEDFPKEQFISYLQQQLNSLAN